MKKNIVIGGTEKQWPQEEDRVIRVKTTQESYNSSSEQSPTFPMVRKIYDCTLSDLEFMLRTD